MNFRVQVYQLTIRAVVQSNFDIPKILERITKWKEGMVVGISNKELGTSRHVDGRTHFIRILAGNKPRHESPHTEADNTAVVSVRERVVGRINVSDQLQEVVLHLDVGRNVFMVTHVVWPGLTLLVISVPHDKDDAVLIDQILDHLILQLGAGVHVMPSTPSMKEIDDRKAFLVVVIAFR